MLPMVERYARWLHLRWPAGRVERLPELRDDGGTNVSGVYVAGDLTGIPLLKFALDSGARVARTIAADPTLHTGPAVDVDLAIVGAGVAGLAAAVEAKRLGITFRVFESAELLSTLIHFPKGKPIYTYPLGMRPEGSLQVSATVKEALVDELRSQVSRAGITVQSGRVERITREDGRLMLVLGEGPVLSARRVIVAIGRSGEFRRLGVPGEDLDTVYNRLHDPAEQRGRRVLVVGGGDSAVETAIALADAGASVTLAHRGENLSRAKPENVSRLDRRVENRDRAPGSLALMLDTRVLRIEADRVRLSHRTSGERELPNDVVFTMLGRGAPLDFFRRSGLTVAGEMTPRRWAAMTAFLVFCTWLYNWKSGGFFTNLWYRQHWFPTNLPQLLDAAGGSIAASAQAPATLLGTLAISASGPSFWYTLAYSLVILIFGVRRIRRRATPYVTAQTLTLMSVQWLPLFLLPEVVLPWLHHNGILPEAIADALFPAVTYGHGREFWRAYGLILAWPLNVYNIFTREPLWWWIGIGAMQTLVLIPLGIRTFGKGFYCGWICSCGALAETLGDDHRHKMPHGPGWNRANLAGQAVLAIAVVLLAVRIVGWALPGDDAASRVFETVLEPNYKWLVDVGLAGILGYGVYFWFSGRFWCRLLCPLAAWMHVVARFSRFAIVAEKKKCISCNQCTSMCHMGIDVMSFANRGLPMQDPECVRCSACVHTCPTGVLQFGQVAGDGTIISLDSLMASPVRMREGR